MLCDPLGEASAPGKTMLWALRIRGTVWGFEGRGMRERGGIVSGRVSRLQTPATEILAATFKAGLSIVLHRFI